MRTRTSWIRPRVLATAFGVALVAPGALAPAQTSTAKPGPGAPAKPAMAAPAKPSAGAATKAAAATPVKSNPLREAYFGQTHSHTSWSMDAYIIGNHLTGPEEAYKYSHGQAGQAPGRLRGEDQGSPAGLPWRDRPLGIRGHDRARERPELGLQQAADRRRS